MTDLLPGELRDTVNPEEGIAGEQPVRPPAPPGQGWGQAWFALA